jgi:hypothetical protein
VSAENGELVWMNAIKSYQRKKSEITQAACRRLRGGNPKKGRLYAMHVRTIIGLAERAPVQAWIVGAIGALEPGDSPDGEGQNPEVEGADMLIGLWDWDRVEGGETERYRRPGQARHRASGIWTRKRQVRV